MDLVDINLISPYLEEPITDEKISDHFFINYLNDSEEKIKSFFQEIDNDNLEKYFVLGVCSLQSFVLFNWIYPNFNPLQDDLQNYFKNIEEEKVKEELFLFDSDYQPKINNIQLLFLSKRIFFKLPNDNLSFLIWKLRFLIVYQSVLNRYNNIFDIENEEIASVLLNKIKSENLCKNLKMRLLLEICQFNLIQNKVQGVKENLSLASECTKLVFKLSGALGKKTHFQKQAKSLLFLTLSRNDFEKEASKDSSLKMNKDRSELTKEVKLKDDTLLPEPEFIDKNLNNENLELNDNEEALLLTFVKFHTKCGISQDDLLKEELMTYLEHLVNNSTVWSVHYETIFQRCLLEFSESRKVERSMLQMMALVESMNDFFIGNSLKLHLFYASTMTPIWKIKKKLAEILISLGCIKEALEIYLELNLWEEIVFCYKQIGKKAKAAELIKERIDLKETPYLLCLLADVTDDISLYEKAWKLSNGKSYLAQKRLGYHYFELKDYDKAIDCFKKSVEINVFQLDTLQRLGYSALLVEDYKLAVSSYRRVLEYDLDNFQAWNNLSKAYIKLNEKDRAFKTLQEALKNNYENWKLWENYIVLSLDLGKFNEVINAWNRLIDIKNKHEDDEIMVILVNSLCCINDKEADYLKKNTLKLLGRITSSFQCSSTIWLSYAKLLINVNEPLIDKILNCLTKAQRALLIKPNWEKNSEDIIQNLKCLNQLIDYYKYCLDKISNDECKRALASFKLTSNNIVNMIKSKNEYWSSKEETKIEIEKTLNDFEEKKNLLINA